MSGESGPADRSAAHMSQDPARSAARRSVVVHGDVQGNVSTGDYTLNVVYVDGKFVETESVLELPLREPRPLRAPARADLFGRDELVAQTFRQLTEGTSVQLYGAADVGKKAIAEEVHRKLAAQGRRGHVLSPRTGETGTLESLYQRLTEAFFGKTFLRGVDETMLHEAVAHVSDVHLTVFDCALSREDVARLMQTFSGCTFLFTSPYLTLPDTAAAHFVEPLTQAAAIKLLSSELGLTLGPVGLQNLQFDHAYRMAEGKPQRLRQYAEFIKGSDQWRARAARESHDQPPPVDPDRLSPQHQAEALAVALSEPARSALVALATFGVPLTDAWFAPVTGDPQAADAGPELYDRRLVTYSGGTYRITEDAFAAVRHQNWAPTAAATAAEGLTAGLAAKAAPPGPDPYLLLTVARALHDAQQWVLLSRLVRVAAPAALAAGRGQIALQLYMLGKIAATHGGMSKDLRYFVSTEEQIRNLLKGDKLAVAAALAILAAPVAPTAKIGSLFGYLAKLASANTAATAGTAAVAVAAATTVLVVTNANDVPAGCAEAKQIIAPTQRPTELRTTKDFVDRSRRVAAGLHAAAGKAADAKVKSALQTRADERNSVADAKEREGDDAGMHPDVVAALVASKALQEEIKDTQEISPVCSNVLE
ncbi:hypothetical protein OHS81_04825 [Streptomyces sp. NBC_00400]|uniref:hypothetical protein n=1 Tax=Streptomyces sp. NBC_00400 TaxID=2975737 RepID=UPI002E1C391E